MTKRDVRRALGVRNLPGVRLVSTYQRRHLRGDLVAGIAVTALMIPHGMAYAELAGVPAVNGLYTTVLALVAYALFGPSRALLLGPDSSLAPLIAAAIVLTAADGDPASAIATASVLGLLTGAFCVLAGLTRLGLIAELLSRPVELGYLNGLAIVMVISQLPKLFGFSGDGDSPLAEAWSFVRDVGELTNGWALGIGVVAVLLIVVLARRAPAVPGVLIAVVGAIVVVRLFDLTERDVDVVGELPTGFPTPTWPTVDVADLPQLALAALGLTWVTLSDTVALSRGFARRTGDRVDANREIMALGASNLAAGLFRGFPVSASTSRTTINVASGGNTQLVGLISAGLVLALVVGGGALVEFLPSTALAAIVVAAAIRLFDVGQLRWLFARRRSEFWLALAAMIGVVTLGVLNGIAIAVALSLMNFIRKVWRPYDAVLGRVEGRKGYHDVERHPDARQIPGLLLFRFDAPIFFANSDHFARRIEQELDAADADGRGPIRRIVVTAEPVTDIDTSGAAMLQWLLTDLDDRGVELAFAELKGPVKDRLRTYGLYDRIGDERFHSTIGVAIDRYVEEHEVEWVDWTDRV